MPKVLLVRKPAAGTSGQSIHDDHLLTALRARLGDQIDVASYSGPRSGADIRFPMRLQRSLPLRVRQFVGESVYPRHRLIHRLDLGAPSHRGEILTIHDLAPIRFPDEGTLPRDSRAAIRAARAVVSVSSFSADEIRAWTDREDVRVIHNGLDPAVASATPLSRDARAELGLRDLHIVLQSGGASQRKNLASLAAAWAEVAAADPDAQLVLTGFVGERRSLFAELPRVHDLGQLPRSTQLGLLAAAAVAVVPSLYEGFGLPAIEAMALGVPVVAADTSALPEVCGGAALLVPPTAEGLADGILFALGGGRETIERTVAGRARAATFTWDRAALQYAAIYDEASRR